MGRAGKLLDHPARFWLLHVIAHGGESSPMHRLRRLVGQALLDQVDDVRERQQPIDARERIAAHGLVGIHRRRLHKELLELLVLGHVARLPRHRLADLAAGVGQKRLNDLRQARVVRQPVDALGQLPTHGDMGVFCVLDERRKHDLAHAVVMGEGQRRQAGLHDVWGGIALRRAH